MVRQAFLYNGLLNRLSSLAKHLDVPLRELQLLESFTKCCIVVHFRSLHSYAMSVQK